MKNQYLADIGDYGKYSMLKAFSDENIKIGINWYLTPDDGSNDGKFKSYLFDNNFRRYNPDVYDTLKDILIKTNKSVKDVECSNIFSNALFYDDLMCFKGTPKERQAQREIWFNKSLSKLEGAELVFMDPDNGLLENGDACKLGAEKYVLAEEVKSYYYIGLNVVFYCHKGRRTRAKWNDYKSIVPKLIPEAKPIVLTFHKGTQRSYIFMIHLVDYVRYQKIIDKIVHNWYGIFTKE